MMIFPRGQPSWDDCMKVTTIAMTGWKVGLTLGKFAPLHRGHQLVIERASAETDHVIVLIYPASETRIPLTVRASWIRKLYPAVEVIEAWDGPTAVGYSEEIVRMQDEYLSAKTRNRGVTHFFSSEPYGEHVSRALGAQDRRVDSARRSFPISSTAIREDPYRHRRLVDPLVYDDLVIRVVFVGAPSTGKTALAERLARQFETVWMPEYGRSYWEQNAVDRRLTPEQLVTIASEHRRLEDELVLEANRVLFVDTEAMITRLFSRYYHGTALPDLERFADESAQRYDIFFLCEDDFPFADTADRSGEANQKLFQLWIRDDLARRRIPYIALRGSIDDRLAKVAQVLAGFEKYTSIADRMWG
jgi:HTH-type transcriptional repressor of NAD biosynthesis genes